MAATKLAGKNLGATTYNNTNQEDGLIRPMQIPRYNAGDEKDKSK